MEWNSNHRHFVTRPNPSFSFLYNYDPCSDVEVNQTQMGETSHGLVSMMGVNNYGNQEKKRRLTSEQLESLEKSFQEEVKLDPDKKMKLSQELGLQPRQIAIWFQNRRARWKAKQLEHLYDALKQEFDVISKEKQKLQEEVLQLKAIVRDQIGRKKLSDGCTMISGEETVESPSDGLPLPSSNKSRVNQHQLAECSYLLNKDETETPPYWGSLCSYPE